MEAIPFARRMQSDSHVRDAVVEAKRAEPGIGRWRQNVGVHMRQLRYDGGRIGSTETLRRGPS